MESLIDQYIENVKKHVDDKIKQENSTEHAIGVKLMAFWDVSNEMGKLQAFTQQLQTEAMVHYDPSLSQDKPKNQE